MQAELEHYDDCFYSAVSSADTLYGSEVVHNVLRAASLRAEHEDPADNDEAEGESERAPQIVFVPYDSRGTAEHGEFWVCGTSYRDRVGRKFGDDYRLCSQFVCTQSVLLVYA